MTNNDIKKLLELANNNEIDKLKDKLTFLLLQSQDKKQANLYKSVEKYLKNSSKLNNGRQVLAKVKKYVRNGSIITFHDSLKSEKNMKYALPRAIEWLKEQGYEFKVFD